MLTLASGRGLDGFLVILTPRSRTHDALKDARGIGQAATLMFALLNGSFTHMLCGNYAAANAEADELVGLADEKAAFCGRRSDCDARLSSCTDRRSLGDAVHMITSGMTALAVNGGNTLDAVVVVPFGKGYAVLGQFDDAWRSIGEATNTIEKSKERWCEAEVNRVAGEITLMSPEPNAAKAEAYFERALAVAREQQAKSWELRAATSMARLWREQGKSQQARELLAPVYGWFTEGFDTLDLRQAKALLDTLAP